MTLGIYENRDYIPRYPQNACSSEREAEEHLTSDSRVSQAPTDARLAENANENAASRLSSSC